MLVSSLLSRATTPALLPSTLALLLATINCGGRSKATASLDASPPADTSSANEGPRIPGVDRSKAFIDFDGCVLTIDSRSCSSEATPTTLERYLSEPCLRLHPFYELKVTSDNHGRGACTSPVPCNLSVPEGLYTPLTLTVGRDAQGRCVFVDECRTDADCAFENACCRSALPRTLGAQYDCPHHGPAQICTPYCPRAACSSSSPRCITSGDYKTCAAETSATGR